MKVFDSTLSSLERSLDARLTRQNVLNENLANVDTPNYRERDVDVGSAMGNGIGPVSLAQTSGGEGTRFDLGTHSTEAMVTMKQGDGMNAGLDGNGVDLDRTMVAMAQNAIQYGATARAASKKLAILRYVASDGNA